MAQTVEKKMVFTPKFRVSFPNVIEPQIDDDGKAVYGLTAIFDSDADLSELRDLVDSTIRRKYPNFDKWSAQQKAKFRMPFRDGDSHDLEKYPEYEGKITAGMRNKHNKPGCLNAAKQPIEDKREFYSGCYAIAQVTAFCYDVSGNKGCAFGLQNVMKIHDGEPLAAGVKAEVAFKDIDPGKYGAFDNADELEDEAEEEI